MKRRTLVNVVGASALLGAIPAYADAWPARPIKVVVPFAPGGATDLVARIVIKRMSEMLKQAMPIENKAGAAGNIGVAAVTSARADGYTVLVGNVSTNALNPVMYARIMKADPQKLLIPIGAMAEVQNVLVGTAAGTLPPNNFQQMLQYVRENPGKMNYSSGGVGSYAHLDMLVLSRLAKLDMVHVPAVGGAGGSTNVQSGLVHLTFMNAANALSGIRGKLVKPFAVTGPARLPQLPEVPTLSELGFPGVGTANWAGMFVPVGTPEAVVAQLHRVLNEALSSEEVTKPLESNGMTVVRSASPLEYARFVREERERFRRIVEENGIEIL